MVQKIGTACQCSTSRTGCSLLSGKGCANRDTCCYEKTEFQETIQDCLDKIAGWELDIHLLEVQFKKRKSSSCDTFVPLSKSSYLSKKSKLEKKIQNCVKTINYTKNVKKASQITREYKSCGTTNICATCPQKKSPTPA